MSYFRYEDKHKFRFKNAKELKSMLGDGWLILATDSIMPNIGFYKQKQVKSLLGKPLSNFKTHEHTDYNIIVVKVGFNLWRKVQTHFFTEIKEEKIIKVDNTRVAFIVPNSDSGTIGTTMPTHNLVVSSKYQVLDDYRDYSDSLKNNFILKRVYPKQGEISLYNNSHSNNALDDYRNYSNILNLK